MSERRFEIEPFFLEAAGRRLFALHLHPRHAPHGAVLYLHPFAEEMHKSRRMAALQARRLADAGWAVLQIDLTGCGDSEGDFSDATWALWQQDALAAYAWLEQRWHLPIRLWGLRLGATLAAGLAARLSAPPSALTLWQPVTSGALHLSQFLRLRLSGDLVAGRVLTGVETLRKQLTAGEAVEVGGYTLTPALAAGMDALDLAQCPPPCPAFWVELSASERPLAADSERVLQAWRQTGVAVAVETVDCAPFWSSQEILECPALLALEAPWR